MYMYTHTHTHTHTHNRGGNCLQRLALHRCHCLHSGHCSHRRLYGELCHHGYGSHLPIRLFAGVRCRLWPRAPLRALGFRV